jgi:hypothetical protein
MFYYYIFINYNFKQSLEHLHRIFALKIENIIKKNNPFWFSSIFWITQI